MWTVSEEQVCVYLIAHTCFPCALYIETAFDKKQTHPSPTIPLSSSNWFPFEFMSTWEHSEVGIDLPIPALSVFRLG